MFPVLPVAPVAPVAPVGPVTVEGAPVGPVEPVGPVGPWTVEVGPVGPVGPSVTTTSQFEESVSGSTPIVDGVALVLTQVLFTTPEST